MKTIFTLVSGLLMSIALMATPTNFDWKIKSMLTIKSTGQEDILVVVDGKRFEPRHNSMVIRNIGTGYHNVKIYRQRNPGIFEKFRNRSELIFNEPVMIRKNINLLITIDRFGRPYMDQQKIKGNGKNNDWNKHRDGRDFDRNNDNDNNFDDDKEYDRNRKSGDDVEYDFDNDGNMGDYDINNGYDYDVRNSKSISDWDFNNVLQSIRKEWFEGNKVKSASQIISGNYFTSSQVRQMLQLFTFENNKLDLAKQAYQKTINPGNYLMALSDVFNSNNSRDELARFVRGNQR